MRKGLVTLIQCSSAPHFTRLDSPLWLAIDCVCLLDYPAVKSQLSAAVRDGNGTFGWQQVGVAADLRQSFPHCVGVGWMQGGSAEVQEPSWTCISYLANPYQTKHTINEPISRTHCLIDCPCWISNQSTAESLVNCSCCKCGLPSPPLPFGLSTARDPDRYRSVASPVEQPSITRQA